MASNHPAPLDHYWSKFLSHCDLSDHWSPVRDFFALGTLRTSFYLRDAGGHLRHTSFHDSSLLHHTYCAGRGYWPVVGIYGNRVSTASTIYCNGQDATDTQTWYGPIVSVFLSSMGCCQSSLTQSLAAVAHLRRSFPLASLYKILHPHDLAFSNIHTVTIAMSALWQRTTSIVLHL